MLQALKQLLEDGLKQPATGPDSGRGRVELAAAVLMVEISLADSELTADERSVIRKALRQMFHLDEHAIAALGAIGALSPQGVRELGEALALLRQLRALLALLFDGVPEPAVLGGPAGRTLARLAGAIDFARLDADMTAACGRVRAWYDRVIARPARRVAQSREMATGGKAR